MGSKGFTGKGATLSIGAGGVGETFTPIAQCKTLQLNGQKWTFDDITNLDSPTPLVGGVGVLEEITPTKMSGGSMAISGVFLPGDAGLVALTTASLTAALSDFKLQLPKGPGQAVSGNLYAFSAYVEDFPTPDVQVDKVITFKANLRITTPITITPGA